MHLIIQLLWFWTSGPALILPEKYSNFTVDMGKEKGTSSYSSTILYAFNMVKTDMMMCSWCMQRNSLVELKGPDYQ